MPHPQARHSGHNNQSGPAANRHYGRGARRAVISRAAIAAGAGLSSHTSNLQREVEDLFFDRGVALAPVSCGDNDNTGGPMGVTLMATRTAKDLETGELTGLVVPDATPLPGSSEATGLESLVNTAHAAGLPILGLGSGVPQVIEALGYDRPADLPQAILVKDGIQLFDAIDLGEAANAFRIRAA